MICAFQKPKEKIFLNDEWKKTKNEKKRKDGVG